MSINVNVSAQGLKNSVSGAESVKASVAETIKSSIVKSGLTEGSYFSGKIQDIIGNSVKISLRGGELLLATMENGIDFNIGEDVNFLVKSNNGTRIMLQSVSPDMGRISQSIINSLEMMGFSLDERTLSMVKEMMAYNMPIDAKSLSGMEAYINAYPECEPADIVSMVAHNIPVNKENIEQFKLYKAYENGLTEGIAKLEKELTELLDTRPFLAEKLLSIVSGGEAEAAYKGNAFFAPVSEGENVHSPVSGDNASEGIKVTLPETEKEAAYNVSGGAEGRDARPAEALELDQASPLKPVRSEASDSVVLKNGGERADIEWESQTQKSEGEKLKAAPQKVIITEDILEQGTGNIKKEAEGGRLSQLKGRWLLDISELQGKSGEEIKQAVNEKLNLIYRDTGKIMEPLKNSGMEKTDVYKSAENIKNSLSFMNDMSQMAAYVQLPCRLNDRDSKGELYVYNKNRHKTLKDGPITAFLHLDMEHLGATDVKVTMDISGRVSTNFILTDPISQDVVEKNLPWLKARLEKQGYLAELTCETVQIEEAPPFDKILEADRPRNEVKRYGFDIRL